MQLWRDEDECRSVLLPMIRAADIILLGHEDAEVLFPDLTEVEIPDAVAAMGPRTVVLKRGDRGAVGLRDGEHAGVDACRVQVVDTVGAGDGFDAGFLAGTLRGMGLRECVELGARVGAAAVAEEGDWEGYPSAEDMGLERQFMQEYPDKEGG
jgi:2-dehydro-3-deoxygluconokinase